jgi:hypothetical protein
MSDALEERLQALRQNVKNPPEAGKRVDPVKVIRAKMFKSTAGSLRAAADSNPDHPVAAAFRKGLRGLPDNKEVTVHHVDVEALLDDLDVITLENDEEGEDEEGPITRIVITKKLGKKREPLLKGNKPETGVVETHQLMQPDEIARHRRESFTQSPSAEGPTELETVASDTTKDVQVSPGPPDGIDAVRNPNPQSGRTVLGKDQQPSRPADLKGPPQDPENFHQPVPKTH